MELNEFKFRYVTLDRESIAGEQSKGNTRVVATLYRRSVATIVTRYNHENLQIAFAFSSPNERYDREKGKMIASNRLTSGINCYEVTTDVCKVNPVAVIICTIFNGHTRDHLAPDMWRDTHMEYDYQGIGYSVDVVDTFDFSHKDDVKWVANNVTYLARKIDQKQHLDL